MSIYSGVWHGAVGRLITDCAKKSRFESNALRHQRRILDAIASPVETRCTDNSMPMHDWAKYDRPAVFRKLSIDIKRKKLERK